MAHSDNNGLVLPPKLAPIQVVLIPIYKGEEQMRQIVERLRTIAEELKSKGLSVKIDDRDNVRSGFKFANTSSRAVPVRLALRPPRLGERHDRTGPARYATKRNRSPGGTHRPGGGPDGRNPAEYLPQGARLPQFDDYQSGHVGRIRRCAGKQGGFISAHGTGRRNRVAIKDATKATIRCIPMDAVEEEGKCVFSGKPSHRRVLFARSY